MLGPGFETSLLCLIAEAAKALADALIKLAVLAKPLVWSGGLKPEGKNGSGIQGGLISGCCRHVEFGDAGAGFSRRYHRARTCFACLRP